MSAAPMAADAAGWTSLLPPLAAIVLAVWTRHVVLSLFVGLLIGVTMLAGWNPFIGLYSLVVDYAWVQISDPWNFSVIVLMLFIGGFVELIVRSGGAAAFASALSRLVTNRRRAQGAVWGSGIVVFFSDSANPLILGPLFAPLFDRLRLSREKLAYLIDSTASAVCILIPITSWAAFVLSLVARELAGMPDPQSPMAAYLASIPFQFYAIACVVLVPMIALLGIEYGPMRKAELEARLETAGAGGESTQPATDNGAGLAGGIALSTVAVTILSTLLLTGGFPEQGILAALASGKSVFAVTVGFGAGALALALMLLRKRAMTVPAIAHSWGRGAISMREVLVILTLAWSLGACCDSLGTGEYVAGLVERGIAPFLVPALVFVGSAVISFATGSAWGCYAIMMPIALPLAAQTGLPMPLILAAVLSGGIFGDHSSPISDTTILSSMGAGCEHVAHVRTQAPYALTAAMAAIVGFVLAGLWPALWTLGAALGVLVGLALLLGWLAQRRSERAGLSPRQALE